MSSWIQNTVYRGAIPIAALCVIATIGPSRTSAQSPGVTWTNIVNAAATGSTLQKNAGCDGCDDAGGSSEQSFGADGFVEFTVGETDTFWVAGLNHGDETTYINDIDFAFRFNGAGYADVLESGAYQLGGDTTYIAGDVFRIAVVGGRVQYSKNGLFLRESAATPAYPLVLDATLGSAGASVRDAKLVISPPPPPGGGLMEKSGSPALRPRFTAAQMSQFLPAGGATGPFTLPGAVQHHRRTPDQREHLRRRCRLSVVRRLLVLAQHEQPCRSRRDVYVPRYRSQSRRAGPDAASVRQGVG